MTRPLCPWCSVPLGDGSCRDCRQRYENPQPGDDEPEDEEIRTDVTAGWDGAPPEFEIGEAGA